MADVRVVSGEPTPEELAAVVAVLQRQADEAAAAGRAEVVDEPRTGWQASARGLRRPLDHGPGAWGRSLR
ncbi:acyl-CoA carboxylase epsilon subunit-like protein [Curtobacterium sp. PhB128]|nr:acyl-CoA carboxylase epsilon subunit-like protein [Curtobacterium sp. PhB78]ROS63817.1 acyl-CoA carboxylase epsilon subunit-like protein [Curtobacterium sp. PhB172]TCL74337.1 acyl-CoA carboxylase epsilon subunit-like protein [Curtobacterium sp. PhB128]TCL91667.1 acyl-CoA carboxylase epsilon subunit-like protein [Curtobacterium sp. PhB138]TCU48775.1 acyl-CoA carboxylase epsilon subunit-like protein [Curtobacterium sp. PhB146]TCU82512.1 acyl-CoA carboxylase epsilon subunit-like protein [Curto